MDPSGIVTAFTDQQVERLTGLTTAQLRHWNKIGFFPPAFAAENSRVPYGRIYSFKDVVGLRTLAVLKGKHGVSLPHLRKVAEKLSAYSKTPWADIRLKVWNRKVQFDEPETGKTRGVVDGQYALLPILDVMEEVRRESELMRERAPSQIGQVQRHRYVQHNAPVIAGTRIPVAAVRRLFQDGFDTAAILYEYPQLTEADVEAALREPEKHAA